MITPTDIIYWDIIPALKKQFVLDMKKLNFKQNQIANILKITPSSVSLYLKNKRGTDFNFEHDFLNEIESSVKRVIENKSSFFMEINYLIKQFEKSRKVCEICMNKNEILNNCDICFK